MRLVKLLIIPCAGFLVVWLIGLFWFAGEIAVSAPDLSEPVSPEERTEAVAVLTGGSDRFSEGLKLLLARYADHMFVSGVGGQATVYGLLKEQEEYPASIRYRLRQQIEFGYEAQDTRGNADEVAEWITKNGYTRVRLVTSNYHMPRSLMELHHQLGNAVTIIPHPVVAEHVKMEDWWKYEGTRRLITSEYNKFLASSVMHAFAGRVE